MKKILVVMQHGLEEVELVVPVDMFRRANILVELASLQDEYVKTSHNLIIKSDLLYKDADITKYDAIFLPGGPTTQNYINYEKLDSDIKYMIENNKLIISICAAPSYLNERNYLKENKFTCYPTMSGVNASNYVNEKVVVSNNFITAKSVYYSFDLAFEVIRYLKDEETLENVYKQIIK